MQDFKGLAEVLAQSLAQIEDVAHSLHTYTRQTEPNPQRLEQLDERMTLWISLARRYKRTPAELPELLSGMESRVGALEAASDIAGLETAERAAMQNLPSPAKP